MNDVKELARNVFALIDAMQSGKVPWSRFDEIVTPGFKALVPGQTLNAAGFKNVMQAFAQGFSDGSHTLLDVVAEADTVMVREVWEGRHTGAFLGAPPSGERVQSTVMVMLKFENGKLSELHETFDTLDLMQKTGVLKA
jgi:predicted ester cyclase